MWCLASSARLSASSRVNVHAKNPCISGSVFMTSVNRIPKTVLMSIPFAKNFSVALGLIPISWCSTRYIRINLAGELTKPLIMPHREEMHHG